MPDEDPDKPNATPAQEFFESLGDLIFWAIVFGIVLGILALFG